MGTDWALSLHETQATLSIPNCSRKGHCRCFFVAVRYAVSHTPCVSMVSQCGVVWKGLSL